MLWKRAKVSTFESNIVELSWVALAFEVFTWYRASWPVRMYTRKCTLLHFPTRAGGNAHTLWHVHTQLHVFKTYSAKPMGRRREASKNQFPHISTWSNQDGLKKLSRHISHCFSFLLIKLGHVFSHIWSVSVWLPVSLYCPSTGKNSLQANQQTLHNNIV